MNVLVPGNISWSGFNACHQIHPRTQHRLVQLFAYFIRVGSVDQRIKKVHAFALDFGIAQKGGQLLTTVCLALSIVVQVRADKSPFLVVLDVNCLRKIDYYFSQTIVDAQRTFRF